MATKSGYYTYFANHAYGQALIANIGSPIFKDDLDKVITKLKGLKRIELSANPYVCPIDAKQIAINQTALGFDYDDWMIPAFVWDENNGGIISFCLVNKSNYSWAYIIQAKTMKAVAILFQKFYIDEGDGALECKQFCDSVGIVPSTGFSANKKKKFYNSAPAQDQAKKDDDEADFEMPDIERLKSFSASSNKRPKNLDIDFSSSTKKEAKPEVMPTVKKEAFVPNSKTTFAEPEIEIEETIPESSEYDEDTALEAQRSVLMSSGFTPNSKPKQNKIPEKKQAKTPQKVDIEFQKPEIRKVFETSSQSRPKQLDEEKARFRTMPRFEYRPNPKVPKAIIVINEPGTPFAPCFKNAENMLRKVTWFEIGRHVVFTPDELPGGDARYSKIANFNLDDWKIVVATLDALNQPTDVALCFKDDPEFAIYVSLRHGPKLICVTTIGFSIKTKPYISFSHLLELLEEPVDINEILPPEKVVESQPKPIQSESAIPLSENVNEKDEAKEPELSQAFIKTRRKPQRRLFVTDRFRKEFEDLCSSHPQAADDIFALYEQIICSDEEELLNILSLRDNKNIEGVNNRTLHKMRFSNSQEYGASRIFFINGYDSKRRMDPSDFIFVGISDEDEHDDQGNIARAISKYLEQHADSLLLHKIMLPEDVKNDPSELAYLSENQIALLDHTQTRCPIAFSGSAGTGKTLLSMSNYIDLVNNGLSTLYITYQDDLCRYVADTLRIEGQKDPNCETFLTLCADILPQSEIDYERIADRSTFREWFLAKAERDRAFKSLIGEIGTTDDERFMTSYVFYNGIIRGAANCLDSKDHRLSLDQFLQKTGKEEGYSAKQREAIYYVALQYDKYLIDNKLETANDLAIKILKEEYEFTRYDAIIIDEYQDLTELQFKSILKLIKSTIPLHLFLYGDDNQSVNPTIFNVGDAERIVKEAFNRRVSLNVEYLNDSYRSGNSLVRFINEFNNVKKTSIGARKKAIEAPERSLRDDNNDLFALLLRKEAAFKSVVELASKSNRDTVFIFPETKICEAAIRKYKKINPQFVESSFLSVEQAKGREWDSVVLYNFFSSSLELFEAILGEEKIGKHSTLHRMLFNRFYVALTRAKNRIIVYEERQSKIVDEKILSHLSVLNSVEEIGSYFAGNVNLEHWVQFGNRLFRKRDYEGALRAYLRASELPEAQNLAARAQEYAYIANKKYNRSQAVSTLLKYQDYNALSDYYESNGERKKYLLLRQLRNESEPTQDVARAFRRMGGYCNEEEKEFFFALAVMRFARDISNVAKQYKEK